MNNQETLDKLLPDTKYITQWSVDIGKKLTKMFKENKCSIKLGVSLDGSFGSSGLSQIMLNNNVLIDNIYNSGSKNGVNRTVYRGKDRGIGRYSIVLTHDNETTTVLLESSKDGTEVRGYAPLVRSITSFVSECVQLREEEQKRAAEEAKAKQEAAKRAAQPKKQDYVIEITKHPSGDYIMKVPMANGEAGTRSLFLENDLKLKPGDTLTFKVPVLRKDYQTIDYIVADPESPNPTETLSASEDKSDS